MSERKDSVTDVNFDTIEAETDLAYCISIDDVKYWLPKSQVEMYEDDRVVVVPDWLVKEKGIE